MNENQAANKNLAFGLKQAGAFLNAFAANLPRMSASQIRVVIDEVKTDTFRAQLAIICAIFAGNSPEKVTIDQNATRFSRWVHIVRDFNGVEFRVSFAFISNKTEANVALVRRLLAESAGRYISDKWAAEIPYVVPMKSRTPESPVNIYVLNRGDLADGEYGNYWLVEGNVYRRAHMALCGKHDEKAVPLFERDAPSYFKFSVLWFCPECEYVFGIDNANGFTRTTIDSEPENYPIDVENSWDLPPLHTEPGK